MQPSHLFVLAMVSAALGGCASARPATPACQVEFLFKAPERPHERLGELREFVRLVPPGGAWEALRPAACALGADVVVVERRMVVNAYEHTIVEGYALRWTTPAALPPAPAMPEAKPAPEPETLKL